MSRSSWVKFLKSHSPLLKPAGSGWPAFCDRFLRLRHFFRHQVADRLDLYIFDCEQIPQQAGTASADADNSQAHPFSRLERDADHGRARTLRCAGKQVRTQNVGRNYESRTAHRGALHETSSRDFFGFSIRCQVGPPTNCDPSDGY